MSIISHNDTPIALPSFCNLGTFLRVVVPVNLLALLAAFARSPSVASTGVDFLSISGFLEPILLASIAILCALGPWLQGCSPPVARGLMIVAQLVVCTAVRSAIIWLLPASEAPPLTSFWLFSLAATLLVLTYLDLRARALSPAIAEARLEALQARIRPHFLFNSLTAVLSLMRDNPARAERALEDLADLFRALMADNRQLTDLGREITLCRQYLDLETLRLGDRLRVVWHTANMPEDALVPSLVFQPLLENAVYHGIEPVAEPGEISINIYRRGNEVVAVLRNPYHADGGHHHAGNKMAVGNIRERLHLHFDVEASLQSQVLGNAYQVTIRWPYSKAHR